MSCGKSGFEDVFSDLCSFLTIFLSYFSGLFFMPLSDFYYSYEIYFYFVFNRRGKDINAGGGG